MCHLLLLLHDFPCSQKKFAAFFKKIRVGKGPTLVGEWTVDLLIWLRQSSPHVLPFGDGLGQMPFVYIVSKSGPSSLALPVHAPVGSRS